MAADDLSVLPEQLQRTAHCEPNGEVYWPRADAGDVIRSLAAAGRVVLGLDVRDYADDGTFMEVAWSDFGGDDADEARDFALAALDRADVPGDWILITW